MPLYSLEVRSFVSLQKSYVAMRALILRLPMMVAQTEQS